MAQTPEGRVKDAVKKVLSSHGAYYYMPMQNGMGRVGVPDFVACVPTDKGGLFMGIETKAPGKRQQTTANQNRELGWIQRAEGVALVVDDAEQLKTALHELLGENNAGPTQASSIGTKAQRP